MANPQRTLKRAIEYEGPGLHSGEAVRIIVRPSEGTGIRFVRTDLPGRPEIPVDPLNLSFRERRTTLARNGAEVQTIEHLLAALAGLWIDHATIEIDGVEVPGADGSALPYVSLLKEAGFRDLPASRVPIGTTETIGVEAGPAAVVYFPDPDPGLTALAYEVDYPGTAIGNQLVEMVLEPEAFASLVAPARTFCLESEVEALRKAGLGKGADYRNTLVVGADGPIENTLRFPDEYARHKLLDLIGDLAVLGRPLVGRVMAYRSGHTLNAALVRKILAASGQLPDAGAAAGRHEDIPALDSVRVEGGRALGSKRIGAASAVLAGHFPGMPVLPGVYELHAMIEAAQVLAGPVRVRSVRKVRFKRRVEPGQRLSVVAEPAGSPGSYRVFASVDGERTAEAVVVFEEPGGPCA